MKSPISFAILGTFVLLCLIVCCTKCPNELATEQHRVADSLGRQDGVEYFTNGDAVMVDLNGLAIPVHEYTAVEPNHVFRTEPVRGMDRMMWIYVRDYVDPRGYYTFVSSQVSGPVVGDHIKMANIDRKKEREFYEYYNKATAK